MTASDYSKSVLSARSYRDSDVETWGTVSGSRTPTPTHTVGYASATSALPAPSAYSHRSNPSYPSPHYAPSELSSFSSSTAPYLQTPGAPYLVPVPLPQQYYPSPATLSASQVPYPTDAGVAMNPLLKYPPRAVFNVTYPCNSIAFRDGLSPHDVAIYPPVPSITLSLSFCPYKTIDVKCSSPNGLTVSDVFVALSNCMLSSPTTYELSTLRSDISSRGKASLTARRRKNDQSGLRWSDFLAGAVYFGGLVQTPNGVYEVQFVSTPLA